MNKTKPKDVKVKEDCKDILKLGGKMDKKFLNLHEKFTNIQDYVKKNHKK